MSKHSCEKKTSHGGNEVWRDLRGDGGWQPVGGKDVVPKVAEREKGAGVESYRYPMIIGTVGRHCRTVEESDLTTDFTDFTDKERHR